MPSESTLIAAIVAMAILTALSRALPFLLSDDSPMIRFFTKENSPLASLGGAIIVAMTVLLSAPFFTATEQNPPPLATSCGIIAAVLATFFRLNTGLSVMIGMAGFFLGLKLFA